MILFSFGLKFCNSFCSGKICKKLNIMEIIIIYIVKISRMDVVVPSIAPNTTDLFINSSFKCDSIDQLDLVRTSRILSMDDDYIVLDKPADVRMNGDFGTTVEKLLVHSFPKLANVNLKWIHQLDYATSGVLW